MKTTQTQLSLNDMPVGSQCLIGTIELNGLLRRRILDLGMIPGTPVECIRRSPSGDPIAFAIRGSTIALRSEDARKIKTFPAQNC